LFWEAADHTNIVSYWILFIRWQLHLC